MAVFSSFPGFGVRSDALGPIRTYSDALGYVQMRLEAFRFFRTIFAVFRCARRAPRAARRAPRVARRAMAHGAAPKGPIPGRARPEALARRGRQK